MLDWILRKKHHPIPSRISVKKEEWIFMGKP
jgi:hypothetical protein